MTPDPVTPAVQTIAQSHQFSDLEKVLFFALIAMFVAAAYAIARGGSWVARVMWPEVKLLLKQLIDGLADLRTALVASDASHTARVDALGASVRIEVQGVGAKVDTLGGTVRAIGEKVDRLGEDVGRRLSGAEDVLTETRLEVASAVGSTPQRSPTQSGLRAVR